MSFYFNNNQQGDFLWTRLDQITRSDGLTGPISIGDSICISAVNNSDNNNNSNLNTNSDNNNSSIGYPPQSGAIAQLGYQGQTGVTCENSSSFVVLPPWGVIPQPLSICTGQAECSTLEIGPNVTIGSNDTLLTQNVTKGGNYNRY